MHKIRLMTDSASDISTQQAQQYDIKVIGFHIVVGEMTYREGLDITTEEFYNILNSTEELPHTSQITQIDYISAYEDAYKDGYTDVVNVVISSTGSNSFNNANMAKDEFFANNPEALNKMNIYVLDSKGYTGAYGFPVIEAAKKIKKGAGIETVLGFLQDWIESAVVVCTAYTLKYAKKSGRVGCVAAFVGEVLGIKPIITFIDAVSKTVDKVRGNKMLIPTLSDVAVDLAVPQTPYAILVGSNKEVAEELATLMKKKTGREPTEYLNVGATIACHLGDDVAGVVVKGERRV